MNLLILTKVLIILRHSNGGLALTNTRPDHLYDGGHGEVMVEKGYTIICEIFGNDVGDQLYQIQVNSYGHNFFPTIDEARDYLNNKQGYKDLHSIAEAIRFEGKIYLSYIEVTAFC